MPSRNILHVRGRGSKSRIRVAGRGGGADAQKACKKVKRTRGTAIFALLMDPSLLPPGMRAVPAGLKFDGSNKNIFSLKMKKDPGHGGIRYSR